MLKQILENTSALITGFATTFKYMFKPAVTVNYPDQKSPMFPKWRGKQVLMRDEAGLEKCVACGLVRGRVPRRRHLSRGGGERRLRHGRPALCHHISDSQDAVHLLRLLRRGVPGVGDLHGQGLRACGVQQERLHLGQERSARPGSCRTRRLPPSGKGFRFWFQFQISDSSF